MRRRFWRWVVTVGAWSVLAVVAGCSEGDELPREAVSGSVTLNGQPLASGLIQFMPETTTGPAIAGGAPIRDGEYAIPRAQGLTPGTYKVSINASSGLPAVAEGQAPGSAAGMMKADLIPARYNTRTTLAAEVTADGDNVFNFDLER